MTLALCVYVFQIPSKDSFDTLSALDIAEQLTYLDHQIFIAIRSESVLHPQLSHWAHNSVMTYFCRNKTCVLSPRKYAYHNKTFVKTELFCRDKYLSWQMFCCNKNISLSQQHFCHDRHTSVTTKDTFCRDKLTPVFVGTKLFVAAKTILVAAPTSDTNQHSF